MMVSQIEIDKTVSDIGILLYIQDMTLM